MEIKKEKLNEAYAIKVNAVEGGNIIGWAYLYIIKNDRHEEPYGFFENLYVEQEYRKHGIGKQLVMAVIEEAKMQGCYKIIGTTRHTKPEVHKFYEKFGFKNHGLEFRLDLKDSKPKQRD